MATAIRLMRMGRKQMPYYRVVVLDSRSPRDGAYIENLGTYRPIEQKDQINIDAARYDHWVAQGAVPSLIVKQLAAKARKG